MDGGVDEETGMNSEKWAHFEIDYVKWTQN